MTPFARESGLQVHGQGCCAGLPCGLPPGGSPKPGTEGIGAKASQGTLSIMSF